MLKCEAIINRQQRITPSFCRALKPNTSQAITVWSHASRVARPCNRGGYSLHFDMRRVTAFLHCQRLQKGRDEH